MAKKRWMVLVLAALVAGGALAQEETAKPENGHKHQPFDMLIGLNSGFGITPNFGDLLSLFLGTASKMPRGNYAITSDIGLTYDFYLFHWLSFNSGLMLHPDIYLILDQDLTDLKLADVLSNPVCLTIPIAAHANIPGAEWLYAGFGLNLNIPLLSIGMDDDPPDDQAGEKIDTKGDVFVSLPIDIGFDFIKPNQGGMRLFFRFTPEIHKKGTAVPISLIWQLWNWKINRS